MTYGYARCSTDETRQDIDRQRRELRKLGVEADTEIYWEYESGTKTERPELQKLLAVLQTGDTIVTTEVSRLTRSTKHLCEIIQTVQERHIRIVIGTFAVDCRSSEIDPMTKGMLLMWGVFAEMERDIISQRVKSGLANAKSKGKTLGRPMRTTENIPSPFWRYYGLYLAGNITTTEMSRLLKCSRTTVYAYLRLASDAKKENTERNKKIEEVTK